MIEGHGDDLYLYKGKVRCNFSSNILGNVDHSGLMEWLAGQPGLLSSYPEPSPESVERRLEEIHGLPCGTVLVTPGVTSAIYMIAGFFRGLRSYIEKPTFREYEDACRMFGHIFTQPCDADLTWVCTPCNPSGVAVGGGEEKEMFKKKIRDSKSVYVVDAAYSDYSVKSIMAPAEALELENVLLLKSFTKRFSVPGLRLGYVVGAESVISDLKATSYPWSVGGMEIAAAHYLMDRRERYEIDAHGLNAEARRVAGELEKMGLRTSRTDCNFFLATLPCGTAASLKAWLVEKYGLLIRDAWNMTGNPADLRIAVQTPDENTLLISAIKEWLSLFRF